MRPTSAELMTRISDALDTTVLPAIKDDKWAASVVRSAMTLLSHLAKRVELEAPTLIADNADADSSLHAVANLLNKYPVLQSQLRPTLEKKVTVPPYDAVALDARNRQYQVVIEAILRELHHSVEDSDQKVRSTLLDYLRRRVGRERDIYFPAFTGPPF